MKGPIQSHFVIPLKFHENPNKIPAEGTKNPMNPAPPLKALIPVAAAKA